MPLTQFNLYFRDYVCMLMVILVHTPDSRGKLTFRGSSPGRWENSVVEFKIKKIATKI